MQKSFLGLSATLVLSLIFLTSCSNMEFKNKTINKNIKATKIYTDLGFAYLEKQLLAKSLLNFKKALNYSKKNASAWHGMALIMQAQKQEKLAQEYFVKSLDLDAKNSKVLNNYALFLYKKQDYKQAKKYFAESIKNVFNPNLGFIYINYAHALDALNDIKGAEKYFISATNINSSKSIANKTLFKFYIKRKNFNKANSLIKKMRDQNQFDKDIKNLEKLLKTSQM